MKGSFLGGPDYFNAQSAFESAAKLYKDAGDEVKAKDSYLKYADACEKSDKTSAAA